MARKTRVTRSRFSRIAVAAVLSWTSAYPALSQTAPAPDPAQQTPPDSAPKPAPDASQQVPPPLGQAPSGPAPSGQAAADQQPKGYSLSDLEYLLGPIALYPDPLLALILPASGFPDQIVAAAAWIADHQDAVRRNDFAEVDAKPWDSSVQALTRFPDVVAMLAEHPEWTESLGWAAEVQPEDVANVVQMLRAKAADAGNLKSTPQQVVTRRQDSGSQVIYIAPADPERIYVPVYDPSLVFTGALTSALVFGSAVAVGSAWNHRWGWNNRSWNQVWIGGPGARPRPPRRGPPPGAWRPDRPGVGRPDRPGSRPDRPGVRPDRPGVRPDRPGARPDRPGVRPDRPGARPDRPGARPDRPGVRPDRPGARPDRPAVRPDRPAARPDRPVARPDGPGNRPGGAVNRPGQVQRPQNRPQAQRPQNRPQAQRPQNRPQVQRPQNRPQVQRPQNRPHVQRPQNRPQQIQRPQNRPPQGVRSGGGGRVGGGQHGRPSRR